MDPLPPPPLEVALDWPDAAVRCWQRPLFIFRFHLLGAAPHQDLLSAAPRRAATGLRVRRLGLRCADLGSSLPLSSVFIDFAGRVAAYLLRQQQQQQQQQPQQQPQQHRPLVRR